MKTMSINNKLIVFREKRGSIDSLSILPYGKDCRDGSEIALFDAQKKVRHVKEETKVMEACNVYLKKDQIDIAKNLMKIDNEFEKMKKDISLMKDDIKNIFELFYEQKEFEKRNQDLNYRMNRK